MIEQAREQIGQALEGANSPVVFWSGGKDSTLLLRLALDIKPDIPCVWFRNSGNEAFPKRLMVEWKVNVLSYWPATRYTLSDGEKMTMIEEYAWNRARFPVGIDVIKGDKCSLKYEQTREIWLDFDVALLGWKASDDHWLLQGIPFPPPDGEMLDQTKLYSPLRDWSDEDVWAATRSLGVPFDESIYSDGGTDEIALCTACFSSDAETVWCPELKEEIPVAPWDRAAGVQYFRGRFLQEA